MIKQAYELAQVKKPLIAATLIHYKQANKATMDMEAPEGGGAAPGIMDQAKAMGSDALEAGKRYGPSVGIGAGAGALAGLPIALLANAVFGKDKSLRGYLRSALMGSLIGGGTGALGGAGLRAYLDRNPESAAVLSDWVESKKDKTNLRSDGTSELLGIARGIPSTTMEQARRGEVGIPGVTADYFGEGMGYAGTAKNKGLDILSSAFLGQ